MFETKIIHQNNYYTPNPRNAKIKYISRKLNQSSNDYIGKNCSKIIKIGERIPFSSNYREILYCSKIENWIFDTCIILNHCE